MSRPVIAAIPHFNNADQLPALLQSLGEEKYYDIVVLDDASDPDQQAQARTITTQYAGIFIAGSQNRGPRGNRNRVIEDTGFKDVDFHFMDSNVTLDSTEAPERISHILKSSDTGFCGGLITHNNGTPMAWNYGPSFTLKSAIGSLVQLKIVKIAEQDARAARQWRNRLHFLVGDWPDTTNVRKARPFFVAEANMFMRDSTLRDVGGFPKNRTPDSQGLAIAAARLGLHSVFTPNIRVRHHLDNTRSNQLKHCVGATGYLIRTYGLGRFLFGGNTAHQ